MTEITLPQFKMVSGRYAKAIRIEQTDSHNGALLEQAELLRNLVIELFLEMIGGPLRIADISTDVEKRSIPREAVHSAKSGDIQKTTSAPNSIEYVLIFNEQ